MQATCRTANLQAVGRPSHVREAVSELIEGSPKHAWTFEAAHAGIEARGVQADPSSVFRALVRLCEDGQLQRFDLGDGRSHYERSDHHHEHIVCSDCGEVAAVPGCLIDQVVPEVETRTGFKVSDHRLTFSGLCGACAETG